MQSQVTERKSTVWRVFLLTAAFALCGVGWILLGESETVNAAESQTEGVLARVGGEAITEDEVAKAAASQLLKVERERHEILFETLQVQIEERLLAAEAKKRGLSTDELIAAEVTAKTQAVTDEQIDQFYQERQAQIRRPKEQVVGQIRTFLQQQRAGEARESFLASLREKYSVEYLMEPFRVTVEGEGPTKGPDSAPVKIVEFSDFECPYCSRVNPTLAQIQDNYGDKVQIEFRQFPLAMHANARKAGEASLCADDQGHFWKMHDLLFGDQQNLGVDGLKEKAATIEGLDTEAFNTCLDSGKYASQVEADFQEGTRLGVTGTPAFFINGRFISGAQPYDNFSSIIDEELELKNAG